jgi:orotate phosphoribosyltransferase
MSSNLVKLVQEHAVLKGDFTLKSGEKSKYYIDMRRLSLHASGLQAIVDALFIRLSEERIAFGAVAGPSVGVDPILGGILEASNSGLVRDLLGYMVHSQPKDHGTEKLVEGQTEKLPGLNVVVVEDVITSGGSVIKAAQEIEKLGGKVVVIISVLDRLQGGGENIEKAGYRYISLLTIDDLKL